MVHFFQAAPRKCFVSRLKMQNISSPKEEQPFSLFVSTGCCGVFGRKGIEESRNTPSVMSTMYAYLFWVLYGPGQRILCILVLFQCIRFCTTFDPFSFLGRIDLCCNPLFYWWNLTKKEREKTVKKPGKRESLREKIHTSNIRLMTSLESRTGSYSPRSILAFISFKCLVTLSSSRLRSTLIRGPTLLGKYSKLKIIWASWCRQMQHVHVCISSEILFHKSFKGELWLSSSK